MFFLQKFVHHPSKICFYGFEWMMNKFSPSKICIFLNSDYNYIILLVLYFYLLIMVIKSPFWLDIKIRRPKEAEDVIADLTEKEDKLLFDALSKKMWTEKENKKSINTPVSSIKSPFWLDIKIRRPKEAEDVIADLAEKQVKLLFDALNKKMWMNKEKKQSKETISETHNHPTENVASKEEISKAIELLEKWKEKKKLSESDADIMYTYLDKYGEQYISDSISRKDIGKFIKWLADMYLDLYYQDPNFENISSTDKWPTAEKLKRFRALNTIVQNVSFE